MCPTISFQGNVVTSGVEGHFHDFKLFCIADIFAPSFVVLIIFPEKYDVLHE